MSVKSIAIQRAITLLKAAGAQYAIIDVDGNKYGELDVAPTKKKHARSGIDYKSMYKPVLESLEPSNVAVIPAPQGVDAERLRSTVTAWCVNKWGKGNHISSVKDGKVEILRVA